MITRACISINNRCNLNCSYCHFHEKKSAIVSNKFSVENVLDNIISHIEKHNLVKFKLGFVGNGEPLLDFDLLHNYIIRISEYLSNGRIVAYVITNGLLVDEKIIKFFNEMRVDVGFSIDGIKEIHNKYRCKTHDVVLEKIELYNRIHGKYPSMNCTVGKEILQKCDETIDFFVKYRNRVTFSRLIGKYGISLDDYKMFLEKAKLRLNVRTGGYDCTMYGGMCAAGMDNLFFANGNVYICGNCIDLPFRMSSSTDLDDIKFNIKEFDRTTCYKETIK